MLAFQANSNLVTYSLTSSVKYGNTISPSPVVGSMSLVCDLSAPGFIDIFEV
jgi:hypothetical protein